jgi:hypothetical protein
VSLVVLPEELPVVEAIGLFHRLRDDLDLPLGMLAVNRTLPDPFSGFASTDVQAVLEAACSHAQGRALGTAGALWRTRLRHQEAHLDRLRAGVDMPTLVLPEVIERPNGSSVVERLSEVLGASLQEAK